MSRNSKWEEKSRRTGGNDADVDGSSVSRAREGSSATKEASPPPSLAVLPNLISFAFLQSTTHIEKESKMSPPLDWPAGLLEDLRGRFDQNAEWNKGDNNRSLERVVKGYLPNNERSETVKAWVRASAQKVSCL